MKFTKSSGAWIDKSAIKNGDTVVLTTEAIEQEGQNGTQIVAKASVNGGNPANTAINGASKNALIDAFGTDSLAWMNKPLTAHIEKTVVAGRRGTALYLIPAGFEMTEDSEGYVVIKRTGETVPAQSDPFENEETVIEN